MTEQPKPTPTSAYDVYQFYLEADDLKGQSHTVKIIAAKVVNFFDNRKKTHFAKIVLTFEKAKKTMVLNKAQAGKLIEIMGTDDFSQWTGKEIILTPIPSNNTIAITTPAPKNGAGQ